MSTPQSPEEWKEYFQRNAEVRAYPMVKIPGYKEWSRRYADRYAALIAHMDGMTMHLHPSELDDNHIENFEELLRELAKECGEDISDDKSNA